MNKIIAAIALAIILAACSSEPTIEEALRYDDKVNGVFEDFSSVYSDYALKSNRTTAANLEAYREKTCNEIIYSIDSVKKIGPFNDSTYYVDALSNYLSVTQKTMQEQDASKIKLLLKDSLMTKDDSLKVKEYTKQALLLTNDAYIKFISAQKKFRHQYKISKYIQ